MYKTEDWYHAMRMNESDSTNHTAAATPRPRARRAKREAQSIVRPGDDQIRLRAYEIYLRRDGRPGDPAHDWFCAERELIEETPVRVARSNGRPKATARKRSSR